MSASAPARLDLIVTPFDISRTVSEFNGQPGAAPQEVIARYLAYDVSIRNTTLDMRTARLVKGVLIRLGLVANRTRVTISTSEVMSEEIPTAAARSITRVIDDDFSKHVDCYFKQGMLPAAGIDVTLHQNTRRDVQPPAILNIEIWAEIFRNLGVPDRMRMARSCRFFSQISHAPTLWERTHIQKPISDFELQTLLMCYGTGVKVLSFQASFFSGWSEAARAFTLKSIGRCCSDLTDLNLSYSNLLVDASRPELIDLLPQSKISHLRLAGDYLPDFNLSSTLSETNITHLSLINMTDSLYDDQPSLAKIIAGTPRKDSDNSKANKRADTKPDGSDDDKKTNHTTLTFLCVEGTYLTELEILANSLPFSPLKYLSLSDVQGLGDKEAQVFAENLPASQLTYFNVSGNRLTSIGTTALIKTLPDTRLTHFLIGGNDIDIEGASTLARVLTQTDQSPKSEAGAAGAAAAAAMPRRLSLTLLDISGTSLAIPSMALILKSLDQTALNHLDVSECEIGTSGAKTLSDVLPGTRLTHLNLRKTLITSSGAEALALAIPRSELLELDLTENQIDALGSRKIVVCLAKSKIHRIRL